MVSKRHAVWLDKEMLEILDGILSQLEAELGFRPTYAQALRYLIKNHTQQFHMKQENEG